MHRGAEKILIIIGSLSLLMMAGCTGKDEGITVTDQDAAALRAKASANVEKQIADIEKRTDLAAGQKQQIIAQIKAGAARAEAGAKAGQGSKSPK